MPNRRRRWARFGRRGVSAAVLVVAVVVLGAGAASAFALTSGGGSDYVTAAVTMAPVRQTLDESGTLVPVDQAAAGFQVAGQVASVAVKVGEHVTAGQVLATLDTSSLNASLTSAQATVSSAEARLQTDEASQTASAPAVSTTSTTPATGTGSPPAGSLSAGAGAGSRLSSAQALVASAQHLTDSDSALAEQDLSKAAAACGTPPAVTPPSSTPSGPAGGTHHGGGPGGSGGPTPAAVTTTTQDPTTTTSTSTTSTTSTTTTSTTTPSGTGSAAACQAALQTALNQEHKVSSDQTQVSAAERTLGSLLAASSSPGKGAGGGSGAGAGSGSGAGSGAGAGSGSGAGSGAGAGGFAGQGASPTSSRSGASAVASPEQIAADQASIDAAQAEATLDQQAMNDATLTTPIAGTVAAVGLSAGQSVPAASSTDVVTVVSPGSFYVQCQIPVTDLTEVKVGDPATVTPAGWSKGLTGRVTSIGVMPPSSSSTATLPVDVSVPSGTSGLFSGADASVQLVVGQVSNSVVVPTSAVHTIGSRHLVDLVAAGHMQPTLVKVGDVGPTYTQVTGGLHVGEQVAIANISEPLPTSGNSAINAARARFAILGGGGGRVFVGGGPGAGRAGGARGGG